MCNRFVYIHGGLDYKVTEQCQPSFKDIACKGSPDDFIVADGIMRDGILLECHQGLTEDLIGHIHSSAADFLDSY